jgi:stage II sporulation protein D (peptidoglycan lytic transglycosylase)
MRVLLGSDATQTPVARFVDAYRFEWSGRPYRGRFESVSLPGGRTGLVNVVPLDAYLYGVVSKEVSAGWPRAALETQAILARTYALGKQRPGKPYDVVAGESDQVYGGIDAEAVEARDAVDATAGAVVMFGSTRAHVAFGSCCGGHTEDAAELWGASFPYLRGVVDPHCTSAPDYVWERDVPYDTFSRAFGSVLDGVGDLDRVELRDVDPSGRARRVALVGRRSTYEMKTTAFRNAIGPSIVRGTLIATVNLLRAGGNASPTTVSIAGRGRGHGVGLCQWGARGMATDGAGMEAILQFYFPGTSIGRA